MKISWKILFASAVSLFALFPLTDSDIWWHLATARHFWEYGLPEADPFCWTPSRSPWICIHLFFQLAAFAVFSAGGAILLVAVKAFLWGAAAFLWVLPVKRRVHLFEFSWMIAFAFLFRFAFECRPVLCSVLFLGIFWNLLLNLERDFSAKWALSAAAMLFSEWLWVRVQGLFPLGFVMAFLSILFSWTGLSARRRILNAGFFLLLLSMPLLHFQGASLWEYPLGLLDRLVGGTSSAEIFSKEIAENRAPTTLLLQGENALSMAGVLLCILLSAATLFWHRRVALPFRSAVLVVFAFLAALAERNLPLFFFPFVAVVLSSPTVRIWLRRAGVRRLSVPKVFFERFFPVCGTLVLAFSLGTFCRSLPAFFVEGNFRAVSSERVPEGAVAFMRANPMAAGGNLFNDDRSGGYLEWALPEVKTFADGRFILKDSAFLAAYLDFARRPETFFSAADSLRIRRALLPVRYVPLWKNLAQELGRSPDWRAVYADSAYAVFDRILD